MYVRMKTLIEKKNRVIAIAYSVCRDNKTEKTCDSSLGMNIRNEITSSLRSVISTFGFRINVVQMRMEASSPK